MTDDQYEKLAEILSDMKADVRVIQMDLAYHIKRTDILQTKMEDLDRDVTKLRGFFTIAGWLVAGLATLLTILNHLKVL